MRERRRREEGEGRRSRVEGLGLEKSGMECVGEDGEGRGGGQEKRGGGGQGKLEGERECKEKKWRKGQRGGGRDEGGREKVGVIRYGVIEEVDWLHLSRWYLQDGASVLMKPSEKGYSIVVEHLLENGANPNLADLVSNMHIDLSSWQ